jgi:putative heme-binding domain-containing protein
LRPRAIELLTQRANWGKALLAAVGEKSIPANMINVNQAQKLNSLGDKELTALLAKHWGTVRTGRDPGRQKVIDDMRVLLEKTPGDPTRGLLVYNKVCGQCHKLHGNGQEVGPDITANGRSNFDQLLSNVFDPSLVIGASYQARTVLTTDGRVITGLLAEDTPQRIVLKVQGGKLETIARGDIEDLKVSELSLMPEQLEKQLKPEELADLFSLLTLDKAHSDPEAKRIPGAPAPKK